MPGRRPFNLIPHLALWLLGLGLVGGALISEWTVLDGGLGFPLDDTWIHLTFAQNLAAGEGLAYNPGEPVSGSTAPLWTALLALVLLLPGNPVMWLKGLGVVLYLLTLSATHRLARRHGASAGAAWLAGALVAATSWMVWSALSGMEICLFTLLTVWGMDLQARERAEPARPPLALPVLGLATLARPEGLLLLLLAFADRAFTTPRGGAGASLRRPARTLLLPTLAALLPVVVTLRLLGDRTLPTTFGAKTSWDGWLPDFGYLQTVFGIFFGAHPLISWLAIAGALVLLRPRHPNRGLLPLLWVVALPLAYSLLSSPGRPLVGNFGRYFFPLFPPLMVLAVRAAESFAQRLGPHLTIGPWRLRWRAPLLVLLLTPTLAAYIQGLGVFAQNVANIRDGDLRVAEWVDATVPPEGVIALQDIGAVGYFTPHRLVDLAGIISPQVQTAVRASRRPEDPTGQAGMERFLAGQQPDLLIVFDRWFPALVSDRTRFEPVFVFEIPNNITMGSDRLIVYRTPWTDIQPLRPLDSHR
ncbi:MAG: hypothetical protein AAF604_03850 [Acidobacteriota bacterium]